MSEPTTAHQSTHSQEGVRHTLEITVAADAMAQRIDQVTLAFRDRARLHGFRKGKAPLAMVRQQFADDIRQRVLDSAIPEHLSRELQERDLEPIDSPALDHVHFEPGDDLRFRVIFDTAPEVTATHLDLTATRPSVEVTEEMVDEALASLRERQARLVPAAEGETAGPGSFVRCHIALLPKDGKGKKLADENRFVRVGEERAVPGLNVQLEGLAVGEERDFVTQLADGYPNAILAGKEVRCRVKVEELKRRHLPEIDDDLARDLGVEDLAALRSKVAHDLEHRAEHDADRAVDEQLLNELRERNPVDVPGSLTERRLDEMVRRFATDLAQQGIDPRGAVDWGSFRQENRIHARSGIAEELLLDKVAADAGIEPDDDAVQAEIRNQMERSEAGAERTLPSLIQQMRKDGSFERLRLSMRRSLALERLRQRATILIGGGGNASADSGSD